LLAANGVLWRQVDRRCRRCLAELRAGHAPVLCSTARSLGWQPRGACGRPTYDLCEATAQAPKRPSITAGVQPAGRRGRVGAGRARGGVQRRHDAARAAQRRRREAGGHKWGAWARAARDGRVGAGGRNGRLPARWIVVGLSCPRSGRGICCALCCKAPVSIAANSIYFVVFLSCCCALLSCASCLAAVAGRCQHTPTHHKKRAYHLVWSLRRPAFSQLSLRRRLCARAGGNTL
jgi:hypothetical protein